MPAFTNFLRNDNEEVASFKEKAITSMRETSVDRFFNAFDLLQSDISPMIDTDKLVKDYIHILTAENLNSPKKQKVWLQDIRALTEKLLMNAFYEMLNTEGVRPEIQKALKLGDLEKMLKEKKVHHYPDFQINEIQETMHINRDEATHTYIRNALVRGYFAFVFQEVMEDDSVQEILAQPEDLGIKRQLEAMSFMKELRNDPLVLQELINKYVKVYEVFKKPALIAQTLNDESFYQKPFSDYCQSLLMKETQLLQVKLKELSSALPALLKEREEGKTLQDTRAALNELTKTPSKKEFEDLQDVLENLKNQLLTVLPFLKKFRSQFFKANQSEKINAVMLSIEKIESLGNNIMIPSPPSTPRVPGRQR